MRTSTEFISGISAPTISTAFDFHLFDFVEVDVYRMCKCMCFIVSIPCHTWHEVDAHKDRSKLLHTTIWHYLKK